MRTAPAVCERTMRAGGFACARVAHDETDGASAAQNGTVSWERHFSRAADRRSVDFEEPKRIPRPSEGIANQRFGGISGAAASAPNAAAPVAAIEPGPLLIEVALAALDPEESVLCSAGGSVSCCAGASKDRTWAK